MVLLLLILFSFLTEVLNFVSCQVSLQYDSSYQEAYSHICGGTLIDAFHIMTAAHCILRFGPKLLF